MLRFGKSSGVEISRFGLIVDKEESVERVGKTCLGNNEQERTSWKRCARLLRRGRVCLQLAAVVAAVSENRCRRGAEGSDVVVADDWPAELRRRWLWNSKKLSRLVPFVPLLFWRPSRT